MYNSPYFNPTQRYQPMQMPTQNMSNPTYVPPIQQPISQFGLLGKSVDSIDVVKAIDIVLDGSVNYFPLTDGSAIVTKQLQTDGTSKMIIYKPISNDNEKPIKYVTYEDLKKELSKIDLTDFEEELSEIKKELKAIKKSKEK